MNTFLKFGASASILAAFAVLSNGAQAATGCTIAGAVTSGDLYTNDELRVSGSGHADDDWNALFGEGAAVTTCDVWNFQGDFAYYDFQTEIKLTSPPFGNKNFDTPQGHFGGAVFWRDPTAGDFGVAASRVDQELFTKNNDYYRFGAFGDFFLNDQVTLGAGAHYFANVDDFVVGKKDHDGFELSAGAKFYATPDLKFSLDGELMLGQVAVSTSPKFDLNGFAITGQADYRFMDDGLSGFVGARYAERTLDLGGGSSKVSLDDMQVFAGLSYAFGGDKSSLASQDRTGPVNNTSTFFEKLPGFLNAAIANDP